MTDLGRYRIVKWCGEYYVNDPTYNDTPARYYAGPFAYDEAVRFAGDCEENAKRFEASRKEPSP